MVEKVAALAHRVPALLNAPPAAEGRLYLTNARLFDGTGIALREAASVLVEDGRIVRVGDSSDAVPERARTIDLEGRTLMPSLTDAHLHVFGRTPEEARGAEEIFEATAHHALQARLREYLRMGVLTLRDCGSQGMQPQEARQAMRYSLFRGPRLLTCAKIISATAPGGRFYGTMYREADGPDDCRKAVREQIRMGADLIKIMTTGARSNELEDPEPTQFTDEEFAAMVDEAHRLGFKVAAHAEGLPGCRAAVGHGMDTIEHGMYLNQEPELIETMARNGQFLMPTLSGYYWMSGHGPEVIETEGVEPGEGLMPMLKELAVYNLEQGAASMRACRDAGVRIALGSDSNDVSLELRRMIHHGLSSTEALVAATKTAAEGLGIEEQVGTVEPGKLADLVVADGDPVSEPELLTERERIWLVVQLGEPVAGAALERPAERLYTDGLPDAAA